MKYLKIAVAILYLLPSYYALGQDINGNSDISYNTSTTETDGKKSSNWNLFQTYYLNYNTYLTPALTSNLGIRYSRKKSDTQGQETIYPFINLGLINEYFSGNLGYNYMEVKSSNRPSLISSFWNTNLASRLEDQWPKLNFQYTETTQHDDLSKHEINTKSSSLLTGFRYQYGILDMMYNYMRSDSLDYLTQSNSKSNNHTTRLEMYKSFWNDRISISADGGYNYFDTTTTVPEAGEIDQRRWAKGGFYGVDISPEYSSLSSAPGLVDRDVDTAVITVQEYMNIGLDLLNLQTVDTIYIHTNKDYSYEPAISSEVLEWRVYYTNDEVEPKTWKPITGSSFSYNKTYHRFEIKFTPQEAKHFKVVYYPGTTSPAFQITEIAAYGLQYVHKISESSAKNYTGNCALSIRPLKNWTTAYYLSYYRTDTSPEAITNYNLSQGINVTGDLSRYFLITLSYQKTTSHMVETNTEVDTYAFNWRSNPLETLNTTLTMSHGETRENNESVSKANTLTFNSIFMLWQGIDVNWDLNLAQADNIRENSKSSSAYSNLYLRALLTRRLSWDLGYDQGYQRSVNNKETTTTTNTSTNIYSTLVYTPSSRLYGRIYLQYGNSGEKSRFSQEYSLGCFITPKIQINASSHFSRADIHEMTHSLDLNWDIASWARFRIGYSYSYSHNDTTQKSQNLYLRFSANF